MALSNIPAGAEVFLDANVQAFYFLRQAIFLQQVEPLFRRGARREIELSTSASVAADVIHRVMVSEAITRFGLSSPDAVPYLKAHPADVEQLKWFRRVPGQFTRARINILPVTYREIHNSRRYRDDYGLLTNDSIILAVMARYKIRHLVTHDRDFLRVPGIRVWTLSG